MDDEDERIRDAVQEAEEKRTKEEAEKEKKSRGLIQAQAEHRHMQVSVLHARYQRWGNHGGLEPP